MTRTPGSARGAAGNGGPYRHTSGGSPYSRFQRALSTGNIALIDTAARELPVLGLGDALQILVVMGRSGDPRYPRAAARWAARATAEQGLDVDQARRVLSLVEVLPHAAEAVGDILARMCGLSQRRL